MKWLKKLFEQTAVRYLISYFGIFSVLVFAFFLVFKSKVINKYFEEHQRSIQVQLETIAENLCNDIESLYQISNALKSNRNIVQSKYNEDSYYMVQTSETLKSYDTASNMINSVIYMPRMSQIVFSTNLAVFYENDKFMFFNSDEDRLLFDPQPYYDASGNQLIFLTNNKKNYLLYFPVCSSTENSVLFFSLDLLEIESRLKNLITEETVAIALVSPEGQIITGKNLNLLLVEDVEASGDFVPLQVEVINGYSLTALLSDKNLTEAINVSFASTYAAFILISVVGIVMYAWAMKLTYFPLHNLIKKSVPELTPKQLRRNEYIKMLDMVIENKNEETKQLAEKINQYRKNMQKALLESTVFSSGFVDTDNMAVLDRFYELNASDEIFVISVNSGDSFFFADKFRNDLLKTLTDYNSCIVLQSDEKSGMFLLVRTLLSSEDNGNTGEEYIERLKSFLHELYKEQGYLSTISGRSSSIFDIPYLCEKAVNAKKCWPNIPVVDFQEMSIEMTDLVYPQKKMEEFSELLETDNFDATMKLVDELLQVVDGFTSGDSKLADYYTKSIMVDMLTTIAGVMNQHEIKFKDYSDLYLETLYLCRSCSYSEVINQIRDNIGKLLVFNVQEMKNMPIRSGHIARIMEESFCDPNFSIYILAERFHISVSHLSNLFKKVM